MAERQLTDRLIKERSRLVSISNDTEKRLRQAPEGNVRVISHEKGCQFYLRENSSDKNGVYMPAAERDRAVALIQKSYDQRIVRGSREQVKVIDRFLKDYDPEILREIYASMPDCRKAFVKPVELPDAEYKREWLSFEYEKKDFSEEAPEHYTSAGERVRSKSEVLIADALRQFEIPYRYECPLRLGDVNIHPDFTILRIADREVLYWEHLGMMDNPTYCQNAISRLRLYEANKIFPGINLIVTMEMSFAPINMTVIRNTIGAYCI